MSRFLSAADAMERAHAAMDRPWKWGEADCCTSACDAFAAAWGLDPMTPLRGRYASQGEAEALIASLGGFDRMTADLAQAAGLEAINGPARPGDIGLTGPGMLTGDRRALAWCVGSAWAVKSPRGMALISDVGAAWRFV